MSNFNPEPKDRKDGGTDYKVCACPNICYWEDENGRYVGKCSELRVSVQGMACALDCDS